MSLAALDNLARIGQLKPDPRNVPEFERMLEMARTSLADSQVVTLSSQGRFASAYNAAHVTALVAHRRDGYSSESCYTVIQCLTQTLNWPTPRWRILDASHQKRNMAEYEGRGIRHRGLVRTCIQTHPDTARLQGSNL